LKIKVLVAVFLGTTSMLCLGAGLPKEEKASESKWALTWSDEFNGPDGAPDGKKWTIVTGGHGFGNNELEYYTDRVQNMKQENGKLVITAISESFTGPDKVTRQYTSARTKTAGNFSQKYGRFEARIKLPEGRGMWPAFWLLGDNKARWPLCGEIDVMENIGSDPTVVLGTLHGPGYSGDKGISKRYQLPAGKRASDDFHLYAVEWEPNVIRFYVDDILYVTRTPADLPPGTEWVFDHPFYVILNLAVGGNLPGNPEESTKFPQAMLVDYVRVYELKAK
jgi:beta-glucanase (GH16 family)